MNESKDGTEAHPAVVLHIISRYAMSSMALVLLTSLNHVALVYLLIV